MSSLLNTASSWRRLVVLQRSGQQWLLPLLLLGTMAIVLVACSGRMPFLLPAIAAVGMAPIIVLSAVSRFSLHAQGLVFRSLLTGRKTVNPWDSMQSIVIVPLDHTQLYTWYSRVMHCMRWELVKIELQNGACLLFWCRNARALIARLEYMIFEARP